MPAYNFQARFAPAIKAGTKRQTIRRRRRRPTRPGDTLYLYVGQRTKRCQKLREAICVSVEPIDIHPGYIAVDGKVLSFLETWDLAQAEGFQSTARFYDFFQDHYGLRLIGVMELIKW